MAHTPFCLQVLGADGTQQKITESDGLPVGGRYPVLHAVGTVAAAGATQIIAAPGAGYRIVVTCFTIQNESATATTMILRAGGSDVERVLGQNQGDGLARTYAVGREWRLPANTALNFVLSGANQCGYSIHYWTEIV